MPTFWRKCSIRTALWVWDWWAMNASCETSWIGIVCGWSDDRSLENTSMRLYWTGGNEEKVRTPLLNNGTDDVTYMVVNRLMYSNAFIDDGALPIKVRLLRCQRLYVEYLTELFTWTSRTLVTGWIYTLMSQPLRRIVFTYTKSRICSVRLSEEMTGWTTGWTCGWTWCWTW